METTLTGKRRQILEFIGEQIRDRGYPPSVREIGEAVGLTSSSTVHTHLQVLQRQGYLRRDPTKPRAISVSFESGTGAQIGTRPVVHVPLIGRVAAGTGVIAEEHVEEVLPLPEDLTGSGQLFMLQVRGTSMIDRGIFEGDYVVAQTQDTAESGDVVIAGIPGDEATVKVFRRRSGKIVLEAANSEFSDIVLPAEDVTIFGRVVTVIRKL